MVQNEKMVESFQDLVGSGLGKVESLDLRTFPLKSVR